MEKYSELFNQALARIEDLSSGSEFVLKDLFVGIEWENFSKGTRTGFGRYFMNKVNTGDVHNVVFIGKAKNNSARYRKTKG